MRVFVIPATTAIRASCSAFMAKKNKFGIMRPIPDFRPKSSFRNGRLPFTMSGFDDECNFTFTLSPYRQGELKVAPGPAVREAHIRPP